jgi:hypothetical protein
MPAPQPPGIPPEDLRVAGRMSRCPAVRLSNPNLDRGGACRHVPHVIESGRRMSRAAYVTRPAGGRGRSDLRLLGLVAEAIAVADEPPDRVLDLVR